MTEQEWLESAEPAAMLGFQRTKASDRKLRLFAASCCRRIIRLLPGEGNREAVAVAERYAEGTATEMQLLDSQDTAREEWDSFWTVDRIWHFSGEENPAQWVVCEDAAEAALQGADWSAGLVAGMVNPDGSSSDDAWMLAYEEECLAQVPLLHDIFGNPFRHINIAPAWLTPTVFSLAQASYDNRNLPSGTLDNARLAVLGDALEDAGCDNQDILNHCRQPGEHVRGCWVLDLLLGKQ